jgi:hypothetical protein
MSEKPEFTNRMQANCIGEFSWKEEAPYYDENGELHEYEAERIVPWTLCKDIYKRMYRYSPLPTHIESLEQENKRLAEREKELEDEIAGWKAAAESTYFDNLSLLEELGE